MSANTKEMFGKLVIKASLGQDIRVLPINNEDLTYDELVLMMVRVFRGQLDQCSDIWLKYRDSAGDLVSIQDTMDLTYAIHESGALLRLHILSTHQRYYQVDAATVDGLRSLCHELLQQTSAAIEGAGAAPQLLQQVAKLQLTETPAGPALDPPKEFDPLVGTDIKGGPLAPFRREYGISTGSLCYSDTDRSSPVSSSSAVATPTSQHHPISAAAGGATSSRGAGVATPTSMQHVISGTAGVASSVMHQPFSGQSGGVTSSSVMQQPISSQSGAVTSSVMQQQPPISSPLMPGGVSNPQVAPPPAMMTVYTGGPAYAGSHPPPQQAYPYHPQGYYYGQVGPYPHTPYMGHPPRQ